MKNKKQRGIPVFAAMCFIVFSVFCGCGGGTVLRFDASDHLEFAEADGAGNADDSTGFDSAGESENAGPAGDTGVGSDNADGSLPEGSAAANGTASGSAQPGGEARPATTEPATIWVYVCGAVYSPGVYELPEDARVFQALEAAGGTLREAELRSLNQAAPLSDGEQVTVYTVQETEDAGGIPVPGAEASADGAGTGKINLNTAGKEQLMTLSGIGEARAQAILSYREEHGPFTSIEEIMNIDGIKEKAFGKIKDEIEV